MRSIRRDGQATLAVLLAGIFFVLIVFMFWSMNSQAKASDQLRTLAIKQQNQLLSAGVTVTPPPGLVKAASVDLTKTTSLKTGALSFNFPKDLKVKQIDANHAELATSDKLFGSSVVPADQLLVKADTGLNFQLDNLEGYVQQAPYAVAHDLTVINGYQVLKLRNKFNNVEWFQAVVARSPQGPYDIFTALPGSERAKGVMETILTSLKVSQ